MRLQNGNGKDVRSRWTVHWKTPKNWSSVLMHVEKEMSNEWLLILKKNICTHNIIYVQVNLFQKFLFLHQLTHNMTKYCSLNYKFSTWKFQAQNMGRTCCVQKLFWMSKQKEKTIFVQNMFSPCSELVVFMYWTGKSMNNLLSYCGLVDVRINASDKDLPVKFIFSKKATKIEHTFR